MDFFRLAWDLNDVAAYLNVLRSPHVENEDTLDAYEADAVHAQPRQWLSYARKVSP